MHHNTYLNKEENRLKSLNYQAFIKTNANRSRAPDYRDLVRLNLVVSRGFLIILPESLRKFIFTLNKTLKIVDKSSDEPEKAFVKDFSYRTFPFGGIEE